MTTTLEDIQLLLSQTSLSITVIARRLGISTTMLGQLIRDAFDCTPTEYRRANYTTPPVLAVKETDFEWTIDLSTRTVVILKTYSLMKYPTALDRLTSVVVNSSAVTYHNIDEDMVNVSMPVYKDTAPNLKGTIEVVGHGEDYTLELSIHPLKDSMSISIRDYKRRPLIVTIKGTCTFNEPL